MAIAKFSGQSYKWPSYEIEFQEDTVPASIHNVRLQERTAGNKTFLTVLPNGEWSGISVTYSGSVSMSSVSTGEAVIALASSGSWSGGSNYSGWIFGKPGAVVWFNRKGMQKWLVFDENGCHYEDVKPGTRAKEL